MLGVVINPSNAFVKENSAFIFKICAICVANTQCAYKPKLNSHIVYMQMFFLICGIVQRGMSDAHRTLTYKGRE